MHGAADGEMRQVCHVECLRHNALKEGQLIISIECLSTWPENAASPWIWKQRTLRTGSLGHNYDVDNVSTDSLDAVLVAEVVLTSTCFADGHGVDGLCMMEPCGISGVGGVQTSRCEGLGRSDT